jgi:xanthine dehydrogenase iron-sulfur cluster and FAD-binding subunit A
MSSVVSQIFYPNNLQEFFNILDRFASVDLFADDAYHIRRQHNRAIALPNLIINTDKVAELHSINRTERYIEIGSMTRLDQIFKLGKIVPEAIRLAMDRLYPSLLRNVTNIGSIICKPSRFEPIAAALIALDVRCELRTSAQSRLVSVSRLNGHYKTSVFSPHEILYRIRIPLEQWDFTFFRYLNSMNFEKNESGVIVFLARIQNYILSDVRIVFSGSVILHDRNCETSLIGQKLPLPKKSAAAFANLWKNYLNENSPAFLRDQILSFIENTILQFTD